MKNNFFLGLAFAAALSFVAIACGSSDDDAQTIEPPVTAGSLTVTFDNRVGNDQLVFNDRSYVNASGDTFTISQIRYWIGDLRLVKANGDVWKAPQPYYLIQQLSQQGPQTRLNINLDSVPAGEYTRVEFLVGVDSADNSNTDVVSRLGGDLEVGIGMNWNWNTGWIFVKMEGQYVDTQTGERKPYRRHIGVNGNARRVSLSPGSTRVGADPATVTVRTDLLGMFQNPHPISLQQFPVVMVGPADVARQTADNYERMFSIQP